MAETATLIAVVLGLTEVAKRVGLKSSVAPVASLVFGLGLAFLFGGFTGDAVFTGIVWGLSASGLFSGGKTLLK